MHSYRMLMSMRSLLLAGLGDLDASAVLPEELDEILRVEGKIGADRFASEYGLQLATAQVKDEDGFNLLHYAGVAGNVSVMRVLLEEKKLQVNEGVGKDDQAHFIWKGATALHLSAMYNHEGVRFLLDKEANIDADDNMCMTPLHYCSISNRVEAMQILLDRKADIDHGDIWGLSPIGHAAGNARVQATTMLLKAGASLAGSHGWNPLHQLSISGGKGVTELLLDAGADVNSAIKIKPGSFLKVLHCGARVLKVFGNHSQTVQFLSHIDGMTPLMWAAFLGREELVQTFLERNADPSLKNSLDFTALDLATLTGHDDCIANAKKRSASGDHVDSPLVSA